MAHPGTGVGKPVVEGAAAWRARFPDLTLAGDGAARGVGVADIRRAERERLREEIRVEGFFRGHDSRLAELGSHVARAVQACVDSQLPPVSVFLFDEPWQLFDRVAPAVSSVLGPGYLTIPAFWAFHVGPGDCAWPPHRDRGCASLRPDGSPMSVTVWIPLAHASPPASTMHVLPASKDVLYRSAEEHGPEPEQLKGGEALPCQPGDYLCWNHAVLHWGSPTQPDATARMSLALEFQRADAPEMGPGLFRGSGSGLGLEDRMSLVREQLRNYAGLEASRRRLRATIELHEPRPMPTSASRTRRRTRECCP